MSLLQDVLRPANARDVDLMTNRLSKLSVPDDNPSTSPRVGSPALGTDSSDEDDELIGVVSTFLFYFILFFLDSSSYRYRFTQPTTQLCSTFLLLRAIFPPSTTTYVHITNAPMVVCYIPQISTPGTPRRLQSRNTSRSTSPTREGRHGAASRRVPGPLHLSSLSQSSPSRPSSKPPKSKTDPVRVLTTDLVQRIFSTLSVRDLAGCSRVCLKWNKSQSLNYSSYDLLSCSVCALC